MQRKALETAYLTSCQLLESEFVYSRRPSVQTFVQACFDDAQSVVNDAVATGGDPRRALIDIMNDRLSLLRISHLAAYSPQETLQMWSGEGLDNGARARLIDGETVIVRVIAGSAAAHAGLKRGDLLIAVDGVPIEDPDAVATASGVWEIVHPDETRLNLLIAASPFSEPLLPQWLEDQERDGVRVLRLPSFLPQVFETSQWQRVVDELSVLRDRGDRLVLDLRGNPGGSFPGMLRALGAFSCQRDFVGWVYRGGVVPERQLAKQLMLPNSLDADRQLETLERNGALALFAFPASSCFDGPVVVLIDQNTRSVAEIFAQAMKERKQTLVLGWSTAGQVVMARWFQLRGLAPDYTLSVPVAVYRSAKGEALESRGVYPDQVLKDELVKWRSRTDPWIAEAVKRVSY